MAGVTPREERWCSLGLEGTVSLVVRGPGGLRHPDIITFVLANKNYALKVATMLKINSKGL